MNRDQQEMSLWLRIFERWYSREGYEPAKCGDLADAAVEQFRKRYPGQPAAPEVVWYDEPPRPGEYYVEGSPCVCWVDEDVVWRPDWDRDGERPCIREVPRNGRRVCPIVKPQEPTTMTATYDLWISPYDHPERPREQQTKGPDKTFVRRHGGPWYRVRIQTVTYKLRRMIATYGFDHFVATHCDVLPQEPPQ